MSLSQSKGGMINKVSNDDHSPMMTLNNKFHLRLLPEGGMEYANLDLSVEYNNTLVQSLYDKRNLLEKIIDLFKSICKLNGIKEFSIEDHNEPSTPTMN